MNVEEKVPRSGFSENLALVSLFQIVKNPSQMNNPIPASRPTVLIETLSNLPI